MKKITSLFVLITMLPFVANAEIASKAYVDGQTNMVVFGDKNWDDEDGTAEEWLSDVGGVKTALENLSETLPVVEKAIKNKQGLGDAFIVTDTNGNVGLTDQVELSKLHFPTPPAMCETKGCMLMYYNGKYVWETVTRDDTENISTTGAVNATNTKITVKNHSQMYDVYPGTTISCEGVSDDMGDCVGF